jgi:homoserine kinase
MALDLTNSFAVSPSTTGRTEVVVEGEGRGVLPAGPANLAVRAAKAAAAAANWPLPPYVLRATNRIPLARGLGSSASAVVGGLVAGNKLLGDPLGDAALLRLAVGFEGHPDNVAAALYGGLVVVAMDGDEPVVVRLDPPEGLVAALCIPDLAMPTHEARAVLPGQVSLRDAVHNLSRTALLVAALAAGRTDVLGLAMQDRLHQPYRARIFRALGPCIVAAQQAGALGAALSGAGSTLLALAAPDLAGGVGAAMVQAAETMGYRARAEVVSLRREGTLVLPAD